MIRRLWTAANAAVLGAAAVANLYVYTDPVRFEELGVGLGVPAILSVPAAVLLGAGRSGTATTADARRHGRLSPARVDRIERLDRMAHRRNHAWYRLTLTVAGESPFRTTTTLWTTPLRAVALRPGAAVWTTRPRWNRHTVDLVAEIVDEDPQVDWAAVPADAPVRSVGPVRRVVSRWGATVLADPRRWATRLLHIVLFAGAAASLFPVDPEALTALLASLW